MSLNNVKVVKKDGTKEEFNVQKVVVAVNKSAYRALIKFSQKDIDFICHFVEEKVEELGVHEIRIPEMHNIVEGALEKVNPIVAKSYRDYRNYKQDFVQMLDEVYKKSQSIMYIGDKENSNTDSALVSTKRSLIFNELNKELYKKFFLTVEELQAIREGYIYIHDMSARRDTMNCCLFDVKSVLTGGFEMGNLWYNEPKTLDTAFDVIGDIVLSAASQQYGGFTVPSVDEILEPYAKRSHENHLNKYRSLGLSEEVAQEIAWKDLEKEMEQGFQGWEEDRESRDIKNRYFSRKSCSFMMKIYMDLESREKIFLKPELSAPERLCIRTGSALPEKAMCRVFTSATEKSSVRWDAVHSYLHGMKEAV